MVLASAALSLVACSEDEAPGRPRGLAFEGEAPADAPAIYLTGDASIDGLVVTVHGKGLAALYGMGFRLTYDPDVLALSTLEPLGAWPADAIVLGREASPGTVVGGLTARGPGEGLDADDAPVARIHFQVKTAAATPVAFVSARSFVELADGTEPLVTWYGGALTP